MLLYYPLQFNVKAPMSCTSSLPCMLNRAPPHPYKRGEIQAPSDLVVPLRHMMTDTQRRIDVSFRSLCPLWYLVNILEPWCLESVALLMRTLTVIIPSAKVPLSNLANLINGGLDDFVYFNFFWVAPINLHMIKEHSVGWVLAYGNKKHPKLRKQSAFETLPG